MTRWSVQQKICFHVGLLYSLNAKCWQPDNRTSPISSRNNFSAGRSKSSGFCSPSPSASMDIICMSPLSIASDSRFSISVSTSSELKFGFLSTSLMRSLLLLQLDYVLKHMPLKYVHFQSKHLLNLCSVEEQILPD